jgi:hypothetical protein
MCIGSKKVKIESTRWIICICQQAIYGIATSFLGETPHLMRRFTHSDGSIKQSRLRPIQLPGKQYTLSGRNEAMYLLDDAAPSAPIFGTYNSYSELAARGSRDFWRAKCAQTTASCPG